MYTQKTQQNSQNNQNPVNLPHQNLIALQQNKTPPQNSKKELINRVDEDGNDIEAMHSVKK